MIIVDDSLKQRQAENRPLHVGLIGAGFMARGIANQIVNYMPGMELSVICNRTPRNAEKAWQYAGVESLTDVSTSAQLEDAMRGKQPAITSDTLVVCQSESIDVLIESTGAVEFGAQLVLQAIEHKKHIVLMNAELDSTVGPYLKVLADQAGIIYTGCDGDQPGVQMNLLRFVESIGMVPRVCGNIKGLQDRYRNPTTQESFARQWGQTPSMVTSFADGTKISFEQAIVANATGFKVSQRGMIGWDYDGHVDDLAAKYDVDMLREHGGIVDYVVGAIPSPGVYIFAEVSDPNQPIYLDYGKLGKGPLYSFYVPYHLTVFEVPLSTARAVLHHDAVIAPLGAPVVDVITAAKVDLAVGDKIDMLGGYKTYGLCESSEIVNRDRLLPIGIAEGATLKKPVSKDTVLTMNDVDLPTNTCVQLRAKQDNYFAAKN